MFRFIVVEVMSKSELVSNGKIYLLSNIVNASIPFLLLPLLTRYLTPTEYGEVTMFLALSVGLTAFVGISVHGIATKMYYELGDNKLRQSKFVGSCIHIIFLTAIVTLAIILVFIDLIEEQLAINQCFIIGSVLVALANSVIQLRLVQWQVRKKAKSFGIFQVSFGVCNLLTSLFFVVILSHGSEGRVDAQLISSALFTVIALVLLRKDSLYRLRAFEIINYKEIFNFGIPLIPHIFGIFLLSSFDRVVIKEKLGISEVGVYMVAMQLSMGLKVVFDALNKAFSPWLYEQLTLANNYEMKTKIVKYTYLYCISLFIFPVITYFFAPFAIYIIAGENYDRASSVLVWLVLGQIFAGMYLMVTNYIFFAKRTFLLSVVSMLSAIIHILLLYVLVDMYGFIGAGYAFTLSMMCRFILVWVVAIKVYSMPWFNFKALY